MTKTIAAFVGAAALLAGAATAGTPDVVLTGELTYADYNHYREIPFAVPEGITRLTVEFSQDGAAQRTTVDLGLADPQRVRGWSGGNKTHFTLAETDATPSYLPGPIGPGTWHLILGIPNIRQGVVSHYRAEISFFRAGQAPAGSHFAEAPLKEGHAWYRGDLHMHTAHSDGSCQSRTGKKVPCPVFRTIEAAEAAGLDFIAISDHNTDTQYDAMRELQPFFDKTLLIPSRELTTFHGHANALGAGEPIEFRIGQSFLPDANAMADMVHRQGGLFSLNHPNLPTGERCMGCGWDAPGFDMTKVDSVEVDNGGTVREVGDAGLALGFWRSLLDRGLSPTAVGGSDNHNADIPADTSGAVGAPATVVYAADLSERAIVDGIKAGHVFIQIRPGDPNRRVELAAGQAMMGDHFDLAKDEARSVALHIAGVEGGRLEILSDGVPVPDEITEVPLSSDDHRFFTWRGDGKHHWLAVLVRDKDGQAVLLSNPLYAEAPS